MHSNPINQPRIKYKTVVLGDQNVGKSSIINRFIYNIFEQSQHTPTVGIDFVSQNIYVEDRIIRLELWDTAGQQRFRSLIPNYIRDAKIAIIVFDKSNQLSFQRIQSWINDVKNHRGQQSIISIVANKIDKQDQKISSIQGKKYAQMNKVAYFEVSAKTGQGIKQLFTHLASMIPQVKQTTILKTNSNNSTKSSQDIINQNKSVILDSSKCLQNEKQQTKVKLNTKRGCC